MSSSSILRIQQLKQKLDVHRPLSSAIEDRIFQKFRLEWNYHSNNIEENSLTYGETKALILFNITAQGKPLKDHFEITGHDEAIKWIMEVVKEKRSITETFIRSLHQLILKESYYVDAITPTGKPTRKKTNVGQHKSSPNHVKTNTGEIFRFAEPEETHAKMADLIKWLRSITLDSHKQSGGILLSFYVDSSFRRWQWANRSHFDELHFVAAQLSSCHHQKIQRTHRY